MHSQRYHPYQAPLKSQYSPKYDKHGYLDMGIDSRHSSEYGSLSPPHWNVLMDSRHKTGYQSVSPPSRNTGVSSRQNSAYQSVSPPNRNYGPPTISAYDYSQEDQDSAYEMPRPPPPYRCMSPTGKTANNKDSLEDKKDESELWEAQAAFLGPNLWDKTLPYDSDLKYVDLDEFLSENGMPGDGLASGHLGGPAFGHSTGLSLGGLPSQITKRERSPSPSECMSPDTINPPLSPADSTFSMASSGRDFDPRTRAFSDEELKPQPMIKKSRKQFVPDDLKDDKYWARRRKNNMAAKRSRDARRMKENQIALRAGYLEKENMGLRQELEILKKENHILREKLSKLTDV